MNTPHSSVQISLPPEADQPEDDALPPDTRERDMTGDEISEALDHLDRIAEALETLASLVPLAMGAVQSRTGGNPPPAPTATIKRRG